MLHFFFHSFPLCLSFPFPSLSLFPLSFLPSLSSLSWFKEDMWNTLSPSLLEGRPNTYTYSKSLGEHVITEEAADLPVAILRPSIIGAAVKDPLPVRREREGGDREVIKAYSIVHVYALK